MPMRDNDGRKIDHKSLETLRLRAVAQMAAGIHPEDMAAALGLARATTYGWLASYRDGGRQALLARSVPGRPPSISSDQMSKLWELIADADPRDQQFSLALWTDSLVRELIRREFGVALSMATVRRLLQRMGMPVQRSRHPPEHNGQRDPEFERWRRKVYPSIREQAAAESAVIYLGPEKSIQPDARYRLDVAATNGSPGSQGAAGDQAHATMLSALTVRTGPRFAIYRGSVTAAAFTEFCARLVHDVPSPVYLIMDRRRAYLERNIRAFAVATEGRLRLLFLPACSTQTDATTIFRTPPPGQVHAKLPIRRRRADRMTCRVRRPFPASRTRHRPGHVARIELLDVRDHHHLRIAFGDLAITI